MGRQGEGGVLEILKMRRRLLWMIPWYESRSTLLSNLEFQEINVKSIYVSQILAKMVENACMASIVSLVHVKMSQIHVKMAGNAQMMQMEILLVLVLVQNTGALNVKFRILALMGNNSHNTFRISVSTILKKFKDSLIIGMRFYCHFRIVNPRLISSGSKLKFLLG